MPPGPGTAASTESWPTALGVLQIDTEQFSTRLAGPWIKLSLKHSIKKHANDTQTLHAISRLQWLR
jgi:hypothetical protein